MRRLPTLGRGKTRTFLVVLLTVLEFAFAVMCVLMAIGILVS